MIISIKCVHCGLLNGIEIPQINQTKIVQTKEEPLKESTGDKIKNYIGWGGKSTVTSPKPEPDNILYVDNSKDDLETAIDKALKKREEEQKDPNPENEKVKIPGSVRVAEPSPPDFETEETKKINNVMPAPEPLKKPVAEPKKEDIQDLVPIIKQIRPDLKSLIDCLQDALDKEEKEKEEKTRVRLAW